MKEFVVWYFSVGVGVQLGLLIGMLSCRDRVPWYLWITPLIWPFFSFLGAQTLIEDVFKWRKTKSQSNMKHTQTPME